MDDVLMTNLHEDIVFNGRFNSSTVVNMLGSQKDLYSDYRNHPLIVYGECASSLCRCLETCADAKVGTGILYGLMLDEPNFGTIGEKFLAEKIPQSSPISLGLALIKAILAGLSYDRVRTIISSVEKLLSGSAPETPAEKIAMVSYMIFTEVRQIANSNMRRKIFSSLIFRMLNQPPEADLIVACKTALETNSFLKSEERRPPITHSTQKAILLEEKFQYYKANKDKVVDDFWRALSDYPEDAVIAYFVMSLPLR